MQGFRLYKSEKLRSRTAVDSLFDKGVGSVAYPLRVVYRMRQQAEVPAQFLITIPKKRMRHAVDRVLLRRRVREAYRLHRGQLLYPALNASQLSMDIAFVYVANDKASYQVIEEKMKLLLTRMARAAALHAGNKQPLSSTQHS